MTGTAIHILSLDDNGNGRAASGPPIPLTVPGDTVILDDQGHLTLLTPSPERTTPPCDLFGRCGGCSHQHLSDGVYARWMVQRIENAFERHGLTPPIADLARSPLGSRRRVTLTAERVGERILVGYKESRSHKLVDVTHCPAMAPQLAAALPALRALAVDAARSGTGARLTATLCANGVDAALTTAPPKAKKGRRKHKPAQPPPPLAPQSDAIVRISLNGETVLLRDTPAVRFDEVDVPLPPGAFLQATLEGEAALMKAVCEGVGEAKLVADCFSGLGTFAVPLSRKASVRAFDSDGAALTALGDAMRHAKGRKPVTAKRRNLFRDPLAPEELKGVDAVVFDPPRAGAEALARALAGSPVDTIVAVSCEPSTLARDCAILTEGGYKITHVRPVDQFVATAHIEAVAVLRREP